MSLESVTRKIETRLTDLAPLDARVKFVVEPAGVVLIDARDNPPTLSHEDAEADTTIRIAEDKFEKLVDGELSPTLAYTLGQIKVEGSLGVAMKLASLLDS
ncbi:MAG: SCP2 sterol-binding domain-containing protein [Geminicoccaceae bacterium]|nr:SCP2 sterol-binding domain-containing protein [Geminicoccaceae bacterium]